MFVHSQVNYIAQIHLTGKHCKGETLFQQIHPETLQPLQKQKPDNREYLLSESSHEELDLHE
jgi:hypothetical protein